MTIPWPRPNEKGSPPRSQEASNFVPSLKSTPVYWTSTVWPAAAAGPLPTLMSLYVRPVGAVPPLGTVTLGSAPSLPDTLTPASPSVGPAAVASGVAASVGASVAAGGAAGLAAAGEAAAPAA